MQSQATEETDDPGHSRRKQVIGWMDGYSAPNAAAKCATPAAVTTARTPQWNPEASVSPVPLDAQYLLRSIVTRMVSRLATEDTVESVTQAIRDLTRGKCPHPTRENG